MKISVIAVAALAAAGISCSGGKASTADSSAAVASAANQETAVTFDADSAYSYVARQVEFGPRVPGTPAHSACAAWLESELRRHGAQVTVQEASLTAFDGTPLSARNIMGSFNPDAADRTLLLAHWDTRPWADNDPDPANHSTPVDGADDGASGVGVLLEIARQTALENHGKGIDILFVDAEDYGSGGDDSSWALGTRYFVQNPPGGYRPVRAVLLDMVGGKNAQFRREYFSQQYAAALVDMVWNAAAQAGHASLFSNELGGAITDDHLELIKGGIPAIDVITYDPQNGFPPYWHTVKDNMDNISARTLAAVGETILTFIRNI